MVTKSAYTRTLDCPRYAWLYQHRRDEVVKVDLQRQWILEQGDVVERHARTLFEGATPVQGFRSRAVRETERHIARGATCLFQASVIADDLHAMADVLKKSPHNASWDIYEVKAAGEVKERHLHDVCFQKIAFERAGYMIDRVFIVNINREYARNGEIDPSRLLVTNDVTGAARDLVKDVESGIEKARRLLTLPDVPPIDEFPCSCSPKDCPSLNHCYPDLPPNSVYFVSRLQLAKARALYAGGYRTIRDIPDTAKLSARQRLQVNAAKQGVPFIDRPAIRAMLGALTYPLYFLDYETFATIVPQFAGYFPNEAMPFQYSLHVLRSPTSELEHHEYLAPAYCDTTPGVVASLQRDIGDGGTVITWNKSFEMGCHSRMARLQPAAAPFLASLNARVFDLKDVFSKQLYVDGRFNGSCSIKDVLPVLVPQLSYKNLAIQEGNSASLGWYRMFDPKVTPEGRATTEKNLRAYCELDTLAMVEIFRYLLAL